LEKALDQPQQGIWRSLAMITLADLLSDIYST
jgi:hypothetical protein